MKHTPLISMLAMFGLGIGAANAAPPLPHGHANLEPGQTRGTLQRKQNIAVVARNHHLFPQPKTQREAVATLSAQPGGALGIVVPESLWNTLSVQHDGSVVRVLESDGTTSAPATTSEGAPNE